MFDKASWLQNRIRQEGFSFHGCKYIYSNLPIELRKTDYVKQFEELHKKQFKNLLYLELVNTHFNYCKVFK